MDLSTDEVWVLVMKSFPKAPGLMDTWAFMDPSGSYWNRLHVPFLTVVALLLGSSKLPSPSSHAPCIPGAWIGQHWTSLFCEEHGKFRIEERLAQIQTPKHHQPSNGPGRNVFTQTISINTLSSFRSKTEKEQKHRKHNVLQGGWLCTHDTEWEISENERALVISMCTWTWAFIFPFSNCTHRLTLLNRCGTIWFREGRIYFG